MGSGNRHFDFCSADFVFQCVFHHYSGFEIRPVVSSLCVFIYIYIDSLSCLFLLLCLSYRFPILSFPFLLLSYFPSLPLSLLFSEAFWFLIEKLSFSS